ncbi:MAG: hypothetical protein K2M55_08210 [Muribaculaceae bacterium]|nr:hypothetical protein [Muribaculaceae bacterium]
MAEQFCIFVMPDKCRFTIVSVWIITLTEFFVTNIPLNCRLKGQAEASVVVRVRAGVVVAVTNKEVGGGVVVPATTTIRTVGAIDI